MSEVEENQEEISVEEDVDRTVSRFVLQSPPTEQNAVFSSLETLIGDSHDISSKKDKYFRQLHLEQYQVVTLPDSNDKMLLTPFGEKDETHYIDPHTKQVITYDHANETVVSVEPLEDEPVSYEEYRAAVEKAVQEYVKKYFKNGVCSVFAAVQDGNKDMIVICINSTYSNLGSYKAGEWKATWMVEMSEGECPLTGAVEINAHLFESGNFTYKSSFSYSGKSDPAVFARGVVRVVDVQDGVYRSALDGAAETLVHSVFKGLRRILPPSRTTLNWETLEFQGGGVGQK